MLPAAKMAGYLLLPEPAQRRIGLRRAQAEPGSHGLFTQRAHLGDVPAANCVGFPDRQGAGAAGAIPNRRNVGESRDGAGAVKDREAAIAQSDVEGGVFRPGGRHRSAPHRFRDTKLDRVDEQGSAAESATVGRKRARDGSTDCVSICRISISEPKGTEALGPSIRETDRSGKRTFHCTNAKSTCSRRQNSNPHGHGFIAATSIKREGKVSEPLLRAIVTEPSSSG
jgi:hypothetical protein